MTPLLASDAQTIDQHKSERTWPTEVTSTAENVVSVLPRTVSVARTTHRMTPRSASDARAEVRYGNRGFAAFIDFIAAVIADSVTQRILPSSIGLASVLVFAVVFVWQFIVLIRQFATDARSDRRLPASNLSPTESHHRRILT